MTLIHTALYPEAKPIIEYFKLKQFQTQPYKVYKNKDIVLCVSGIGKIKTINCLEDIFMNYSFSKAFNIGIAGCKDETISIGTPFCIENKIDTLEKAGLTTVDQPLDTKDKLNTLLVDMEAEYFKAISLKYLDQDNIYIIKVVSDHLNKAIPKKSFVNMLINDSIGKWCNKI